MREQIGVSQSQLAYLLGESLNSLRMWDSGMRPTPAAILQQAQRAAAEALRKQALLKLPELARELNVHVRTLQAAARGGRLEVNHSLAQSSGVLVGLRRAPRAKHFSSRITKGTADSPPESSSCLVPCLRTTAIDSVDCVAR